MTIVIRWCLVYNVNLLTRIDTLLMAQNKCSDCTWKHRTCLLLLLGRYFTAVHWVSSVDSPVRVWAAPMSFCLLAVGYWETRVTSPRGLWLYLVFLVTLSVSASCVLKIGDGVHNRLGCCVLVTNLFLNLYDMTLCIPGDSLCSEIYFF